LLEKYVSGAALSYTLVEEIILATQFCHKWFFILIPAC